MPLRVHSRRFQQSLVIHWHLSRYSQLSPIQWNRCWSAGSFLSKICHHIWCQQMNDLLTQREKFSCFYFPITAQLLVEFQLKPHCKLFSYGQCGLQLSFITTSDSPGSHDGFPLTAEPMVYQEILSGQTLFLTALSGSLLTTKSNFQSLRTLTQTSVATF